MQELRKHYEDVYKRGWTRQSYTQWRGSVIQRINKMYRENNKNLSDREILEYLDRSRFSN